MINKKDLAKICAEKQGITKSQALENINNIFDEIENILKEKKDVNIVGFGSFRTILRPKRIATNPQNGETFELDERRMVKFQMGKHLKKLYK
jgi:DNA-binding protein HU-beta